MGNIRLAPKVYDTFVFFRGWCMVEARILCCVGSCVACRGSLDVWLPLVTPKRGQAGVCGVVVSYLVFCFIYRYMRPDGRGGGGW